MQSQQLSTLPRKSRATQEWREYYRRHREKVGANQEKYLRQERVAYYGAKGRCTRPNEKEYHRYGGRGIQFRFRNFDEFFAHIGPKPHPFADYSLDRIDNDGHYEAGNVKWSTRKEQIAKQTKPRDPVKIAISMLTKRGYAVIPPEGPAGA